jgi:hypothetical protein
LLPEALIAIALIGASLSIVFGCLDLRNTHLYRISEENLRLIEKHYLYKTPLDGFSGIIATEHSRYGNRCLYRLMKFRFLMKSIYVGAFLLFAALAFHGVCLENGWFGLASGSR